MFLSTIVPHPTRKIKLRMIFRLSQEQKEPVLRKQLSMAELLHHTFSSKKKLQRILRGLALMLK